MATSAVDPPAFRPHQDELLHGTRAGPGPVSYTSGSYYTMAPVGPSPKWPKPAPFYPLDKPRRQQGSKPSGVRDAAWPALRSRPSQQSAATKLSKAPLNVRRSPTSSSEDLDLPSTPSPRATAPELFSDSTNSRDSSTPSPTPASPTPASPPSQPKPALRRAVTASGSSSFTSRRFSLEGRPATANILFPHQSFSSTTYSSRSHDSYLHTQLATTASAASSSASSSASSRLPKRVSFADNLESTLNLVPAPAPADSPPRLHTSLRACRHPTCTACNAGAPATTKQQTPPACAPATAQLDSICSTSTSSSLTDPASAAADPSDPAPRGPPTPPLELDEASYENPTFADCEEVFHTPRSTVDDTPQPTPCKPAASTSPRAVGSAPIRCPDSPVLPMPVRTPSLTLNPLHLTAAAPVGSPAAPMAPHHLPITSDQTVPRHPALLSGPRAPTTHAAPTPTTGPATPAEPSTPRAPTTATPLASPRPSPIRTLQARLAALTTAPAGATPHSPAVTPTAHSADAAAPKPSLSLRARLQMPSTFLRSHAALATAPAASPSKPPKPSPPKAASAKASVLKSLNENGYERQKNGWGLLMWDSSAAVTRKASAAQHSLFGFEAAMLAEIEAQKARAAEEAEAYKVAPGNSIIGSCGGGWREAEAARKAAAAKAADCGAAPVPAPAPGAGFVNLGAAPGAAEPVAPFGCFMPFMRSKKAAKVREIR